MITYPKRLSTIYKEFIKKQEDAGIEINPSTKEKMLKHIEKDKNRTDEGWVYDNKPLPTDHDVKGFWK